MTKIAKKFEDKSYDVLVRTVTKTERQKKGFHQVIHKLVAIDTQGIDKIVMTSGAPFGGVIAGETILQIKLQNSQKSLKDFNAEGE